MVRSLALALAVATGCAANTHEIPESSVQPLTAATTTVTSATAPTPWTPHFQISDSIYASCGIANRTDNDVAESTAMCLRTGPLSEDRVRVTGSRHEVEHARKLLVEAGVPADRIETVYGDGPAQVEVIEKR
jgi:hypothetical protein